jgi:hypothetical protein
MPAKKKATSSLDELFRNAPALDLSPAQPHGPVVRLVGRLRSVSDEFVALTAHGPAVTHLVIRKRDVRGAQALSTTENRDPEVELRLEAGAPVLLGLPSLASALAITAALVPRAPEAPFALAIPHHAQMAYNPPGLGGNVPLGGRGGPVLASERGTDWLRDTITLPEGPADPPSAPEPPDPEPLPEPKGTDWLNDPIPLTPWGPGPLYPDPPGGGTTFLNDQITLPEGPVGPPTPPPTSPWIDVITPQPLPPMPTSPWVDAIAPGPYPPPWAPPRPPKNPLDDLIPPWLRDWLERFTGPGGGYGIDYRWPF